MSDFEFLTATGFLITAALIWMWFEWLKFTRDLDASFEDDEVRWLESIPVLDEGWR